MEPERSEPTSPSTGGPSATEAGLTLFQQIQRMTVAEKVRCAFRTDKEGRTLLLKDSSKLVVLAVLNSPKITEQEVEAIAKSRSVSEEVLRAIARKREWMAIYSIKLGLVGNPKTPVGISLPHVQSLKNRDLSFLAKDRGVPEAIRTVAARLARARQEKGV